MSARSKLRVCGAFLAILLKEARATTLRELPVSDQTTISFANLSLPQRRGRRRPCGGGAEARSGGKGARQALEGASCRAPRRSAGSRARRTATVDLLAPAGLKFARLVLMGTGKTADYTAEDWLNLGGTVRGHLDRQRGARRAYRARWGREGHRARGRRQFRARRVAPRLQIQKIQIDEDAEEERRRRERQDAQEDRHPLPPIRERRPRLYRGCARHRQRRDARPRSRQRACERARAGRVRPARQGAHQGGRAGGPCLRRRRFSGSA